MKKSPYGLDNKIRVFSDLLKQEQNADDLREILSCFTPQELGTDAEFLFLVTARIVDAAWDTPEAMDLIEHCLDAAAFLRDANDREDLWLELGDKLTAIPEPAATRLRDILNKQSALMPSAAKAYIDAELEALHILLGRLDLTETVNRLAAVAQGMSTEHANAYMTRHLLPLVKEAGNAQEWKTLRSHITPEMLKGSFELRMKIRQQRKKIFGENARLPVYRRRSTGQANRADAFLQKASPIEAHALEPTL